MAEAGQPRIALAQINPTVGDLEGNARLVVEWAERAAGEGAALVVFPELCLPGYPAEDLYLKHHFAEANVEALESIAGRVPDVAVVVGFAEPTDAERPTLADAPARRPARNALAVLEGGRITTIYRKMRLPNYGVFDEVRYFEPGSETVTIAVEGVEIGLTVCEDLWEPGGPASTEARAGARLILNPSGSPYLRGKGVARERMLADRAREIGTPIAFCNLVGGQDDLVFDGHSFVVDAGGAIVARARQFEQDLLVWDPDGAAGRIEEPFSDLDEVYSALVLGLGDYARKNGFRELILGLSGGIDSALVALLAVDAFGPERVRCVVMPSPHSSAETQQDARAIARNLGTNLVEIPIGPGMKSYEEMLAAIGGLEGLAAENVQARIRGNLLMAISNAQGGLVLATGNKSETSVGYSTLYGDMAGGLSPIKDVPKRLVYDLVEHRNEALGGPIPESVITRPPSAELRPDQRDEDSLPPYELLDRVLEGYVERDLSRAELVAEGLPEDVVDDVIAMVNHAEYKRRQSAPGIRITSKAFGRDRRLPITNRYTS